MPRPKIRVIWMFARGERNQAIDAIPWLKRKNAEPETGKPARFVITRKGKKLRYEYHIFDGAINGTTPSAGTGGKWKICMLVYYGKKRKGHRIAFNKMRKFVRQNPNNMVGGLPLWHEPYHIPGFNLDNPSLNHFKDGGGNNHSPIRLWGDPEVGDGTHDPPEIEWINDLTPANG